jgi:3'(2'), 5'-bisphosphate nucleotidase
MENEQLLHTAIVATLAAGEEILKVYNTNFKVDIKSDETPVTIADKNASDKIIELLKSTEIPVLSEEGEIYSYEQRQQWRKIWIIDPLDGTKEFIKRNGEFTVNIALIENQRPVIGVIYSPASKNLYFALKDKGSFKVSPQNVITFLNENNDLGNLLLNSEKLPNQKLPGVYTVVASRSHLSPETYAHLEELKFIHQKIEMINTGSSVKLCLVAEGKAHEYPRFGNTMEWDIAAGQCIVEQAGGEVIDEQTKQPMLYNRPNLLNNHFIAKAKKI